MSAGFAAATAQQAPQVVIVHDKFHVAKMLNETVDSVLREEHKELLKVCLLEMLFFLGWARLITSQRTKYLRAFRVFSSPRAFNSRFLKA